MTDKPVSDRPTVSDLRKAAHDAHEHILIEHADMDRAVKECEAPHDCHNKLEVLIDTLADRLDQKTEEVKKANAGFARLGGRLAGVYADLKCEMSRRLKAEREVERLRQHGHHGCDECARNRAALKEPK